MRGATIFGRLNQTPWGPRFQVPKLSPCTKDTLEDGESSFQKPKKTVQH